MKILTRALKEEHRRAGLYLEELEHVICLMQGQKVLEVWTTNGPTLDTILKAADGYKGA